MFKIYTTSNNLQYEIHDNGEIYRIPKKCTGAVKAGANRKKLKTSTNSNGYSCVNLGSVERNIRVHRLVAKMFCEQVDGATIVNHINGNKQDNRAVNLEWCTYSENMIHSHSVLRQKTSIKTDSKTREEIIDLFNRGNTMVYLAREFDLGYNTIRRIISGAEYPLKTDNSNYIKNNKTRKTNAERIPSAVKENIKTLRENGLSYSSIAKELNISKFTVAKELGWQRNK